MAGEGEESGEEERKMSSIVRWGAEEDPGGEGIGLEGSMDGLI